MNGISSTFRSDQPSLGEMLSDIEKGSYQLPDFQRGWIWDDDHIRSLIGSVSLSFPIGAVMLIEAGSIGLRFKIRPVEGVELDHQIKPDKLVLDGQQRLTSLYLALKSDKPVPTRSNKGQKIERHYYLDIAHCLDPEADREEAIVSLSVDRQVRSDFGRVVKLDLSTREKEFENGYFPCDLTFRPSRKDEWRRGYNEFFDWNREKGSLFDRFEREVLQRFQQYRVPVIELLKDTDKVAVCQVFEKVSSLPKLFSCFLLVVFLSFPSPSGKRVSACPLKKEVLYAVYPTPGSADREAVGSAL